MPASDRRHSLVGLLLIAAAGLIWGTIPLVLHAADAGSAFQASPFLKVFYRVLFAGVVIFVWMALSGGLSEFRSLSRQKLVQLTGQGAILTLNWILFFSALGLANVATAELLGYMGPVFVAALAPFVTGERFDRRIVLPMLLALGGIVVILAPQGISVSGGRQLLGASLAFASALTYAWLLLRSKRILLGVSGMALMLVEYAVASVLLLPIVAWLYLHGQGPTTVAFYGALAVLGVVQTAFASMLFLTGLRRVRTDHAAILTYAEPASAVLFAALFLSEPLTVATVAGGAMVVAGGALVARLDARDVGHGIEAADSGEIDDADHIA
jgi:drug/metabolite transporter (DMT)-like permease